jgi:tetratricopeptide (TPR) repeat protein/predicted Ser/Thr protein kinase
MQPNVGRYRILRPLGRGAMGLVYLAEDPSLNRQVAIKMLDVAADSESDREFMHTRLLRDARAAAVLSHPNIVSVFDIVEEGTSVYVVMEYIEGESLASFLDHTPTPDHIFILHVLRQAAGGLDYTHSKGIIHRDIKPGNIMITPSKGVKILDFGIARMADTRTSTPTGIVMGTIDYMAPEQVKAALIDGRADQFSLAAVAYRMLAGSTLFGRHTLATLAYKLVNEAPPPVRQRNAMIPAGVDVVLAKALAKSPEDRYPDCSAFVRDLSQALTGAMQEPTVSLAAAIPVMTEPTQKTPTMTAAAAVAAAPKKSTPMAAWLAGGALLAAGAGAVVWHPWNSITPPPTPSKPPVETVVPVDKPKDTEPPPVTTAPPPVETKKTEIPAKPKPKAKPVDTTPPPPAKKEVVVPPPPPPKEVVVVSPPPSKPPQRPTYEPQPPLSPRAIEPPPPEVERPFRRGQDAMKAKDYKAAVDAFSQVIQNRPKFAEGYFNRGYAYEMSGEPAKAVQDYSDAIRIAPRMVRAWANRGICEVRLRQDDPAFADFNHALELDPNYAGALNGRGGILMRRKDLQGALRDFNAAIKANPEFEIAYENRAKVRQDLGDRFGAADDKAVALRLHKRK